MAIAHKTLVRKGASGVARLLPYALLRLLVRGWALGVAQHEPAGALRKLLQLHDDLYLRIDVTAISYGGGVHVKHGLMRYHDFFVERVAPGERVLDVGCGKAELAHDLAERAGAVVLGLDPNRAYLEFARARFAHPRLTLLEGTAPEDVPPEPFDVVVLSNVLEHVEHRVAFLRELVGRVGPQRILVRVPMENRDWLVPLRRELGLPHYSDPTHFVEYDERSFVEELAEAGLVVTHRQVQWGELWAEATPR